MGNNFWHGGVREKLDFSANLNPFPLPERIRKIYSGLWEEIMPYPDPFALRLREALAKKYGGDIDNYLVSNGSSEIFFLLMWGLKFWQVFIPYPTYGEYERVANIFKKKINFIPLSKDFRLDLSSLPPPKGKEIVFICNPNNPTGNFLLTSPHLPKMERRIWIIDETYIEITDEGENISFLKQAREREDLLVIRSFTKTYSLAGLRLGYLSGNKNIIKDLYSKIIPWSVNHIAQRIGEEVLKEEAYIKDTRKKIEREREFISRELSQTHFFNPYPSKTNFIMIKLPFRTGRKLKNYLEERNIYIRFLSNIRGLGEDYARIGVMKKKENQILLTHLKEFIGTVQKIS